MPLLLDGTEVTSDSEAWRHECEARQVINWPSIHKRREYLNLIGEKRGLDARKRLENTIRQLWSIRNGNQRI